MDGVRKQHRVFYTSMYGGFWVFTRYEDIRAILQDPNTFGQHLATLQLRPVLEEVTSVLTDLRLDPERPFQYLTSQAKTVLRHLPVVYTPVKIASRVRRTSFNLL